MQVNDLCNGKQNLSPTFVTYYLSPFLFPFTSRLLKNDCGELPFTRKVIYQESAVYWVKCIILFCCHCLAEREYSSRDNFGPGPAHVDFAVGSAISSAPCYKVVNATRCCLYKYVIRKYEWDRLTQVRLFFRICSLGGKRQLFPPYYT